MSWIVVLESEGRASESLREALSEDGWLVDVVTTYDAAIAAVSEHGPDLVVANAELSDAGRLLNEMARGRGGPGSLALTAPGVRFDASDEVLRRPFSDQDLRMAVRDLVTQGRAPKTPPPADEGERLTSQDLFGDVLAEVEESPAPAPPPVAAAPSAPAAAGAFDSQLSSMLQGDTARTSAPKREETAVDDLLSQTLAGLEVDDRGRKKSTPKAAKPPEKPKPAPAPETPKAKEAPVTKAPAPSRKPGKPRKEIDFAELDALARPGRAPGEKTPSGIGSFATQKIAVPGLGKAASGPVEFGQYTLLERIALGGMAEVWKARMKGVEGFQKTVAIKKILPHLTDSDDFVTMFIDEAKLAAQLNHNNIIHIYDLGKLEDDYYIAMEFVDGKDLRSILNAARERDRPVPMGLALLVASRLAAALDHAHRQKDFEGHDLHLVHRDVSPQNVLISYDGDIKLCDFGIVKAVSKVSKTQMGALKGKIQYMSPEQAWGRPVDARSDLFSLGALLFEMLTGRKLFAGETEVAVLDAVREGRIQAPRDLDPRIPLEVNALVLHALAKEPGERFSSAGDLQHDLDAILASLKPVPTQLELSRYLRELFGAKDRPVESAPVAAAPAAAVTADRPSATPATPAEASTRSTAGAPVATEDRALDATPLPGGKALWIGLAAAVVLAALGFFAFRGGDEIPAPPPAREQTPPSTPAPDVATPSDEAPTPEPQAAEPQREDPAPAPTPPAPAETAAKAPETKPSPAAQAATPADAEPKVPAPPVAAPTKSPEPSPAAATPAAEPTPVPAQATPTPTPAETKPVTSEPAVAPPEAAPKPAPAPAATRRAEPKPAAAAAPAPPAPAPTVREGDLVALGPGVTPPQLVSVDKPQYPPMARRLKVEGTVVVSVLVDENGRVTDVKLENGVRQNVGINEAAIDTARSAKFRPASQDGVRVKTWYRLNIPFKL